MMKKYGVPYAFMVPELNATYKTNKMVLTCPHCGKIGKTLAAMKRWHFDKCNSLIIKGIV
jgi:ribosomal protein L37AE/L43A